MSKFQVHFSRLSGVCKFFFLLLLFFCDVPVSVIAQNDSSKSLMPVNDTGAIKKNDDKQPEQKDVSDLIKQLFRIKHNAGKDSIRNSKDINIAVLPAAGYSLQSKLAVLLTGNITFGNMQDTNARLSVITASAVYTQNKQILFPLQSIIWSNHDKYLFLGDWRVMKYPQDTYGLGGYSSLDSANHMDYNYLKIHETVYRKVAKNF